MSTIWPQFFVYFHINSIFLKPQMVSLLLKYNLHFMSTTLTNKRTFLVKQIATGNDLR